MNAFPLTTAGLIARRSQNYLKHLERIVGLVEAAEAKGFIMKRDFDDAKHVLGRVLEDAWSHNVREPFFNGGKFQSLTEAEYNLDSGSLMPHTIEGAVKRIRKSGITSPVAQAMLAVLAELGPLCARVYLFNAEKRVKKLTDLRAEQKTEAARVERERYVANPVAAKAREQIRILLTKIADDARRSLTEGFAGRLTRTLNRYMQGDLVRPVRGRPDRTEWMAPYEFFVSQHKRRESQDPEAAMLVAQLVQCDRHTAPTIREDAAQRIQKQAEWDANAVIEFFILKNLAKLASIIEAKGGFKNAELVNNQITQGGLEGMIRVTFADGSAFTVNNSIVFHQNAYGTRYNRFPLTFHNVTLANGKAMKSPSEKRMNEVFAA